MPDYSRIISVLLLVGCIMIGQPAYSEDPVRSPIIIVEFNTNNVHIHGTSVPITFELKNTSEHEFIFITDYLGLPKGLKLSLIDAKGTPVKHRKEKNAPRPGPPTAPTAAERYMLKKGESIALRYHLADMFQIDGPGVYVLTFTYGESKLLDRNVIIVGLSKSASYDGKGVYTEQMQNGRRVSGSFSAKWVATIGRAKVADGRHDWYMTIESVSDTDVVSRPYFLAFRLPGPSKILKMVFDYRCQLWAVVKSHGKQALFVWDIASGEVLQVLDWDASRIELKSTRVRSHLLSRLAIAGRSGERKVTSMTILPLNRTAKAVPPALVSPKTKQR